MKLIIIQMGFIHAMIMFIFFTFNFKKKLKLNHSHGALEVWWTLDTVRNV